MRDLPSNRLVPTWVAVAAWALCSLASPASAAGPPKLLLISVDGLPAGSELRADVMPALAALASAGARCAAATSPSPLEFPAVVALLSGAGPERTQVRDEATRALDGKVPTLAATLTARGYRALALPGDPLAHAQCGLARGFERYDPRAPGYADSARVDSALAWLSAPGNRFAWLDLSFGAPAAVWRRMDGIGPREPEAFVARAREIDAALARLTAGLQHAGLTPGTLIAIAGTGMPPIGFGASAGLATPSSACAVPIVFAGAGITGSTPRTHAVTGDVRLTDVAPTLVAAAGGRTHDFGGRNLLAPTRSTAGAAKSSACDADLHRAFGPGSAPPSSAGVAASASPESCWMALIAEIQRSGDRADSVAIERLHALSLRDTTSPRLTVEWAVAMSRHGQEYLSARTLKELVAKRPDYPEAAIAYAEHLVRFKRFEIVRNVLAQIAPESPLAAVAGWRDAVALASRQNFEGAIEATQAAAQLAVLNPGGLDAAATLQHLQSLKVAVDLAPTELQPRIDYARALAAYGMRDPAFEQLHAARADHQRSAEPDYWIASLLMEQGRAKQAAQTLLRGLDSDPTHRPSRLLLSEAYMALDQRREARAQLELALSRDPIDARGQFNLACLRATDGERDAALTALGRAVDQGYADWAAIEGDPDLQSLRADPRYAQLLARKPH